MIRATHSGGEVARELDLLSRAEALMPDGDRGRGRAITIQRLQDTRLRRDIAEQLMEQPEVSRAFRNDIDALNHRLTALVEGGSALRGLDDRSDEDLRRSSEVIRERVVVKKSGWSIGRILLLAGLGYVAYKLWPYVTGYVHDQVSPVSQRKIEDGIIIDADAAPPARAPGSTIETKQFGGTPPAGSSYYDPNSPWSH